MKPENVLLAVLLPLAFFCPWNRAALPEGKEGKAAPFTFERYAAVLRAYVDESGRVDYGGLAAHREGLDAFLREMSAVEPARFAARPRAERMAFLLNAYNARVLQVVAEHYPDRMKGKAVSGRSIRNIEGVWKGHAFPLLGRAMTLDRLENEYLRKAFGEPRIHFALVCGAKSCPPLRREPYEGKKLEDQLEDQARRFLLDPGNFRIDREAGVVYLSEIFRWFGEDFVPRYGVKDGFGGQKGAEAAVLRFITGRVSKDAVLFLASEKYRIAYLPYDWSLNLEERTGKLDGQ